MSTGIIWSILQEEAAYREQSDAVYNKKYKKNARRAQRKQKEQQRNRYWDSFWTVSPTLTNAA